jgi:hypothetical protein
MENDPRAWPQDMIAVFSALGEVMDGRRLQPDLLAGLSRGHGAIVDDHVVEVTHMSGRALGQKQGRYTIEIRGARWLDGGRWTFISGQLEALARAARR